jgi:hypothetical protein
MFSAGKAEANQRTGLPPGLRMPHCAGTLARLSAGRFPLGVIQSPKGAFITAVHLVARSGELIAYSARSVVAASLSACLGFTR